MSIEVRCESCGRKMLANDSMAEKEEKCIWCGAKVIVPQKPPEPPKLPKGEKVLSNYAKTVFSLGILGFLVPMTGIIAAVMGGVKLQQIKSGLAPEDPTGYLKVGFILGIIGFCLNLLATLILIIFLAIAASTEKTKPQPIYPPRGIYNYRSSIGKTYAPWEGNQDEAWKLRRTAIEEVYAK
jgi:DNA-directed RNA polymerase subunit RPC12/RpoP